MASGAVGSGILAVTGTPDGTKVLQDDFTWVTPGAASLTSGSVNSGKIASGAVQGFFGATRHIASGTVGVFDFGSGAVIRPICPPPHGHGSNPASELFLQGYAINFKFANTETNTIPVLGKSSKNISSVTSFLA